MILPPPLDFIEVDHSKDLVGTWTCLESDFAEALVINADGSVVSTGVEKGEYWDSVKGNIKTVNNKMKLTFEDGDNYEGRFEMICGEAFTIFDENGEHLTYRYCANDLADEVVGMWVCHEGLPGVENDMAIKTYSENGKYTLTTQASAFIPEDIVGAEADYVIIGDLLFMNIAPQHIVARLTYPPNGTTLGDIMTETLYAPSENGDVYLTSTWLRVKETLDLAGKTYDYSSTYVTNVKGLDEDFEFAGQTLNYSTFDGSVMNKIMKNILLNFSFPTEEKFVYTCYVNDKKTSIEAPIVVDGNKVTIKMSENKDVYRDIDVYTFQDADATQLHMYMPRSSFVKFFANIAVATMVKEGTLDLDAEDEVKAVYDKMEEAFETINVSFVFKARK